MAGLLPWTEIEYRVAALAPISRAAHLAGPGKHAERLIDIWRVAASDDVPLAQAWRLLDREAVAGAILRTLVAGTEDASCDRRYWTFPSLVDLLPALRDQAWQAALAGVFAVEGIKEGGKRYCTVSPLELERLVPDWDLSRLVRDGRDMFVAARIRRRVAEPTKPAWRLAIPQADLKTATEEIAKECAPGQKLPQPEFWARLKKKTNCPELPRRTANKALRKYAPQLEFSRGRRPVRKSD